MKASAWMLTNRSACTRRAFCTRTCSGTKKSASRVRKARIGLPLTLVALMRSRSRCAICSTTSFSRVPPGPTAPGSSPPWPGSSAMMIRRSVLAAARRAAWPRTGVGAAPRVPGAALCCAISSPSGSPRPGGAGAAAAGPLSFMRSAISASSGSAGLTRVEVDHQPVLVGRDRRQREHLRQRRPASGRSPGAPRPARAAPTRMPAMNGSSACTLATSSRSAGLSSMPSMSTASRGGLATTICLDASSASDSMVTRE